MTAQKTSTKRVNQPASWMRTILILSIAFLAGRSMTYWFAERVDVPYVGFLRAQSTEIVANVSGHIEEIAVETGELAEPGHLLFVIADASQSVEVAAQEEIVEQLEFELQNAQARAEVDLAWRLKDLDKEILLNQLKSAEFLKTQFDEQLGSQAITDILEGQSISPVSFSENDPENNGEWTSAENSESKWVQALLDRESAINAAEVSAVQASLCDQRLDELRELKMKLTSTVGKSFGVDRLEKRLSYETAKLEQLQAQTSLAEVASQVYGTVGSYHWRVGDKVAAGEKLVELLDEDIRHIEVDIPSRMVTQFVNNPEVQLEFPDGTVRTGSVIRIPPNTKQDSTHSSAKDALVTLRIRETGKLWPRAPIGSAIDVRPLH